jgi:predicted transcriptional regulator
MNSEEKIIVDQPEGWITPTPKKRGRPAKVEREIFIQTWNKGANLNAVAEALGMPTTSVSVKASLMRKGGAKLKKFRRGRKAKVKV